MLTPIGARAVAVAVFGAISWFLPASVAYANGAFPDSQSVLLSSQRSGEIVVAANFGLIVSEDDGQSWLYSCENRATANGRLYNLGSGPDERILAISDQGAATSADRGCTWVVGGGLLAGALVSDVFPDPADATHVLAVAKPFGDDPSLSARVFSSNDGGVTYDRVVYAAPAPPGAGISGVEIARSDPRRVYVTWFETTDEGATVVIHPRLARSKDGGSTFETIDLEPSLGPSTVSLAAVDPNDADHLFLRVVAASAQMRTAERIAVSVDGGVTFSTPVNLSGGILTNVLVRRNGTVLVTGRLGATAVGYRSRDGGATFASWRPALHPRGLGERGTTLFMATDNAIDGFALASSEDDGDTWTPRLRFGDIKGVRPCVQQACGEDCRRQAALDLFPIAACGEGGDRPPAGGGGGAQGGPSVSRGPGTGSACSLSPLTPRLGGGAGPHALAIAAVAQLLAAGIALILARRPKGRAGR